MNKMLALVSSKAAPVYTGPDINDYTLYKGSAVGPATLTQNTNGLVRELVLTGDWPAIATVNEAVPNDVQVTARVRFAGWENQGLNQHNLGLICRASVVNGDLQGYLCTVRSWDSNFSRIDLRRFWPGDDTAFPQLLADTIPADISGNAYRGTDVWLQVQAEGTTIRFRSVLANTTAPENVPVVSNPPANTPVWPSFITATNSDYSTGSVGIAGHGSVDAMSITLKHLEWEAI